MYMYLYIYLYLYNNHITINSLFKFVFDPFSAELRYTFPAKIFQYNFLPLEYINTTVIESPSPPLPLPLSKPLLLCISIYSIPFLFVKFLLFLLEYAHVYLNVTVCEWRWETVCMCEWKCDKVCVRVCIAVYVYVYERQ